MECTRNNTYDSYTRYRTVTAAAVQREALRTGTQNLAMLATLCAFWGCVMFVILQAMIGA